jgi:serine/threonine protein kinase
VSGSSELRIGETFAGYRVEAEAGRGGMGVVYRATHLRLERTVALKLIAPALASDPAFVAASGASGRCWRRSSTRT